MRVRVLSPVLAAGLVAAGIAVMAAQPSQASPVKLYFHSAGGGYLYDIVADPAATTSRAPAGSTMDAKAPTKTTSAEARGGNPLIVRGGPLFPTFSLPFTGDVTSVCLDVFVRANVRIPLADVGIATSFYSAANLAMTTATHTGYTAGTVARVTALVKPNGVAKHTLAKDALFHIRGVVDTDNDLTLLYDSVTHPSSITINPAECKAAPLPSASAGGSATPSPGGSATPSPGGSGTPSPGGTATPSPDGSGTPSPGGTATPSGTPSPTASPTPPPPPQETGLDYTGSTSGRYSDSAPVSARATLPDGRPVPTGSIEFTVGSDRVTLPVNASGVASGRLPLRTSRPAEYLMTVRYVANSAYLGSGEQVPFFVQRMGTRCAITRTVSGSSYVLTATLRDALGRALAGQMVTFSYNGRAFRSLRTDRAGRAQASVAARRGTYGVYLPTTSHYAGCSASLRV